MSLISTTPLTDLITFDQADPTRKRLVWRTDISSYDSGKEQRNQVWSSPLRVWTLNYSMLPKANRDEIIEYFQKAHGRLGEFLHKDSDDYLCTGEQITTDGVSATYQLCKTYYVGETGAWTEDKKDIVPGDIYQPVVTHSVDGAQTEMDSPPVGANKYSLDDTTGIMEWEAGNEPSAGILTCTYQFYFRVRFVDDNYLDVMMYPGVYSKETLDIIEVKR